MSLFDPYTWTKLRSLQHSEGLALKRISNPWKSMTENFLRFQTTFSGPPRSSDTFNVPMRNG